MLALPRLVVAATAAGRLVVVLTVETLTPADWPIWRSARLAALAEAPHAFKSRLADWQNGDKQRWRARMELPGILNIVASLDGETVGMASGIPGDDGTSELRSVWVDPAARGRGVGDQLIATVEAWALRSGATTFKLSVIPGNQAAMALYQRNGFVLTDELGALLADGTSRECVMVKPLCP